MAPASPVAAFAIAEVAASTMFPAFVAPFWMAELTASPTCADAVNARMAMTEAAEKRMLVELG